MIIKKEEKLYEIKFYLFNLVIYGIILFSLFSINHMYGVFGLIFGVINFNLYRIEKVIDSMDFKRGLNIYFLLKDESLVKFKFNFPTIILFSIILFVLYINNPIYCLIAFVLNLIKIFPLQLKEIEEDIGTIPDINLD